MTNTDPTSAYADHVARLRAVHGNDEAMRLAIGGEFIAVGKLEHYLLRSLGLTDGHLVVDVGCGSGRLACQLAPHRGIRYIGCDIVPQLLDHARALATRDDWNFHLTDGTTIPAGDGEADFVVFFSVFTHLLHEDTFRYFREARRCLGPAGRLVFSFLEFSIPCHWPVFADAVERARPGQHLNQFIGRDALHAWAEHGGFKVEGIWRGDEPHIPIPEDIRWEGGQHMSGLGNLGQSVAVLRKNAG